MHIAFEGPIGAGKTTLAKLYASHVEARLFLEDFDGNKFLSDFYQDKERWGLAMQLWFLSDRHAQLSKVASSSFAPVVADHSLAKDRVFAHLLLKGRDLDLYERISAAFHDTVDEPTVIVLLDAHNDTLLQRIKNRGRSYERAITSQYLDDLRGAYDAHFSRGEAKPIKIDTTQLDLTSISQLHDIFDRIQLK